MRYKIGIIGLFCADREVFDGQSIKTRIVFREIESAVGKSHVTVQRYLVAMRERGEIEYDGHRSIVTPYMREMLETNRAQMGNSIPCGALDDVIDAEIEHLRLPKAITGEGEFFLLRARGESMINAGIDSGDLVLIRKQNTANEGDIVVALIDDSATLKTLSYDRANRKVVLKAENDDKDNYPNQIYDNIIIQGVAEHVLKKL